MFLFSKVVYPSQTDMKKSYLPLGYSAPSFLESCFLRKYFANDGVAESAMLKEIEKAVTIKMKHFFNRRWLKRMTTCPSTTNAMCMKICLICYRIKMSLS